MHTNLSVRNMGTGQTLLTFWRFSLVVLLTTGFLYVSPAQAASVTTASDTLSTMKESVVADQTIKFTTPTGVDQSSDTITITWPAGFSISGSLDYTDVDLSHGATTGAETEETLAASAASGVWGVSVNTGSRLITLTAPTNATSGEISANDIVIIEIGTNATAGTTGDQQITNQSASQNNTDGIIVIGGTFGDSGSIAVEIVADNVAVVSATVDPRITCAFTGLTVGFPNLTGPVTTASTNTTVTISTNANNGFNLSVRDAGNGTNPGLYKSTASTYLIGSADSSFSDTATLTNDVDGFGIQGSTSGGSGASVTIAARYNQVSNAVGGLELTPQTLASATAAVASRVVTVVHKAAVSGLAPAGAYTDSLTYVCTGIF